MSAEELEAEAGNRGIETRILRPDDDPAELARNADADAVGVAGGDGSLAAVAEIALERDLAFVVVPYGTRNHFARDLGLDRDDPLTALDAFTGHERRVDVGRAGDRLFLNNVSLGLYGDAVRQAAYREAKLRTLLATAKAVVSSTAPAPALRVVDDLGQEHSQPAVVLVSNNPYAFEPPPVIGTRPRLDGAQLGIVVLDAPATGRNAPARAWGAATVEVHAAARVHAGIDGEAVDLDPLLRFAIRPEALRVRISSRHPGVSPSGRLADRGPRRPPR